MRRFGTLCLLVVLAACADDASNPPPRQVPPPDPQVADVPQVGTDPNRWVDENFAAGWFRAAQLEHSVMESENDVDDASSQGGSVNYVPAGEVPPDSRDGGDPPPRSVEPGERGLGARPGAMAEEEEEMPRFGAASEGVSAFGGAWEENAPPEPWQRSSQTANAARLMVGDEDALPLQSFQATVRVDGHRARIVLDYCYLNAFDFDAEGTFKLRLPDDAAVHYLAFGDVVENTPLILAIPPGQPLSLSAGALTAARGGGEIHREARIVPKEKAQEAYAAETAQAVDPALMEWNGAGVFTTHVFPLLSERTSRITVAYDVDLLEQGGARFLVLGVPTDAKVKRVIVDAGSGAEGRQTFQEIADPVLRVTLPSVGVTTLIGNDPAIGPHFATSIVPDLPTRESTPRSRAIFVLDASMSSNPDRMNVWLDLMRATLERNRGDLTEFGVLLFNVETWWWRDRLAPNEPETVELLMQDLARVALEGATDVGGALRAAAAPSWTTAPLNADLFLLSDGAETWGAARAADIAVSLDAPVYCYTTGLPGTDTRALQTLARESGGGVFAVTGASDVNAAAVAHRNVPWSLREVRVPGCSDVLVAGRPSALYPGQRLRIAGRGRPNANDAVMLTLEQAGETREVTVQLEQVIASDLAPRAYGEVATGQLESLGELAGDEARAYSLHYGVTGETCSLLMLESEESYLEYGIVRTADAEVVRSRTVESVLASLAAEVTRARADAREAFLVWLDRLERLAGDSGGFRDLDELRAAARALPVSAFEVVVPPMSCKTRSWDDVSGGFAKLMRAADPGYGAVWSEAEGRLSVRGAPDAMRALSSLVEADPGSVDLQRDIAFTALDWELPGAAYGLLRRVAAARPFEPETYRAMAECLEQAGNLDYAMLVHELALRGSWDERFGAFPLVAALDYRGLLRRIEHGRAETRLTELADAAREWIATHYVSGDPDLVVTMTWNTDRTDVDLHVVDPAGEVCMYDHPRTELGGAITEDVTGGYGPEMFVLGRAVPGEFIVKAHYFGSDAMRKTLRSRVFVTITRYFGTAQEHRERRAFLLKAADDVVEITRLTWE